jgi:hypothetical protein
VPFFVTVRQFASLKQTQPVFRIETKNNSIIVVLIGLCDFDALHS